MKVAPDEREVLYRWELKIVIKDAIQVALNVKLSADFALCSEASFHVLSNQWRVDRAPDSWS